MSRLIAILFALSTVGAIAAPPRIAVVRVANIYEKLPSTRTELTRIEAMRSEILKDRRADDLRKLVEELQALQGKIQKLDPATNDSERQKLLRDYEIKRTSIQSLQQEFEKFRAERTLEINRKMVAGMHAALDRISKEASTLAKNQGYDWLVDSSGSTNTGLPLLIYSKDAKDLTDEVLALLSKETAVSSSEGATAPESSAPAEPDAVIQTPAPQPPTPITPVTPSH